MKLWLKDNKIVADGGGKPIDCVDCPCPGTTVCANCIHNTIGDTYQVDIAGIVSSSGDCADCASLNGTYIIPIAFMSCGGHYDFPADICGYYTIQLGFEFSGGVRRRHVYMSHRSHAAGSDIAFIEPTSGSDLLDCMADFEIDSFGSHFNCDDTAATCTLTAI